MKRPNDPVDIADALQEIGAFGVYEPPAAVWDGIVRELDRAAGETARGRMASRPGLRRAGAVVAAAAVGVASLFALGSFRSSWSIERVTGTPKAGARSVVATGNLAEGEWLETDRFSRARLSLGSLGSADVGPGSRVKLVQAGGAARMLRVDHGSIHARVWAPPRFFVVETPAATAVDLGCVYSLDVDADGNGTLLVRSGQVELHGRGRQSIVVAGTAARMRAGLGPGTPYAAVESPVFRDALAVVDFGGASRAPALRRLLDLASTESTITLWHLLPRVGPGEREQVYDRLAAIAPPPGDVTRAAVLSLDRRALAHWRTALEPAWSTERVRLWKRAWRALWSFARGA